MDKCPRCSAEVLQADTTTCPACGKSVQASAIAAELKASEAAVETKTGELATALAQLEALKPLAATAEEATKAKTEVEASLQASQTQLTEANSKVETAQTELAAAQKRLAEIKAAERESELKPFLGNAWAERGAAFLAMDDETFTTVAASIKDAAKKPAPAIGLRSGMPDPVAGSENGHSKISLR